MDERAQRAKKYLQEAWRLRVTASQQAARLRRLRETEPLLGGVDYSRPRADGGDRGGFAAQRDRIMDMEREAADLLVQCNDGLSRIEGRIQSLSEPAHIDVLHRRYIEGQSLAAIASALSYSTSGLYSLHESALLSFATEALGL